MWHAPLDGSMDCWAVGRELPAPPGDTVPALDSSVCFPQERSRAVLWGHVCPPLGICGSQCGAGRRRKWHSKHVGKVMLEDKVS